MCKWSRAQQRKPASVEAESRASRPADTWPHKLPSRIVEVGIGKRWVVFDGESPGSVEFGDGSEASGVDSDGAISLREMTVAGLGARGSREACKAYEKPREAEPTALQ